MAENIEQEKVDWEALYQFERTRVPVREVSPDVDRNFVWQGSDEQHPIPIEWLKHYASAFHFSDAEILAGRKTGDMPRASGVYFLFLGDQCFYIGQTGDFSARAEQHKRNGVEWTSHAYIEVPKFHAPVVEAYYIRRLKPPFNATYPPLRLYSDMVDELGLDAAC